MKIFIIAIVNPSAAVNVRSAIVFAFFFAFKRSFFNFLCGATLMLVTDVGDERRTVGHQTRDSVINIMALIKSFDQVWWVQLFAIKLIIRGWVKMHVIIVFDLVPSSSSVSSSFSIAPIFRSI